MNNDLKRKLAQLLSIKSIVTIMLVGVFCYECITGHTDSESLKQLVTVVIAFYFGTITEKGQKG